VPEAEPNPDEPQPATPPSSRALPVQPPAPPNAPQALDVDPSEEDAHQDQQDDHLVGAEGLMAVEKLAAELEASQASDQETAATQEARERLERRLADRQLVEQLRQGNFSGQQYDYFANDLCRYGLSVMRGWLRTGHIFSLLRERGIDVQASVEELEELALDREVREEIITMTVPVALDKFHEQALVQGGWDPAKGASITTYFMGACVLTFANIYRSHRRQRGRWKRQDDSEAVIYDLQRRFDDTEAGVVGAAVLRERLATYSDRERRIIAATLIGHSQEEIVEMYAETSVRAVEGVLHRWRTREQSATPQDPTMGGIRS